MSPYYLSNSQGGRSNCTNLSAAKAIRSLQEQDFTVTPLQEHHGLV